jgi:PAS domain-containing protein
MKKICGWCRKDLGEVPAANTRDGEFSTGICKECGDFFCENKADRSMVDFLNSLRTPVVVADGDCRIQFANTSACQIMGRSLDDFRGFLGGDAFQCARARLPGGCGQTEHCKACTIRRSIEQTHKTGGEQENISAALTKETPSGEQVFRFLISTRKQEDVVFLKIDEIVQGDA